MGYAFKKANYTLLIKNQMQIISRYVLVWLVWTPTLRNLGFFLDRLVDRIFFIEQHINTE